MYIIRALLNDNDLAIDHKGLKAILVFKSIKDTLYWIQLHNILCEKIYEIKNLKSFKKHLDKNNLHVALYNSYTKSIEIYKNANL